MRRLLILLVVAGAVLVPVGSGGPAASADPPAAGAGCIWDCTTVPASHAAEYMVHDAGRWWHYTAGLTPAERATGQEYAAMKYCYWRNTAGCNSDRGFCGQTYGARAIYSRPIGSAVEYTTPQEACIRELPTGPPPVTAADVRRAVGQHRPDLQQSMAGAPLRIQPPGGLALILVDVIALLNRAPADVHFTATINTQPVQVRAYPAAYTWNFDGCPATTTADIGHTYPDQDAQHSCHYSDYLDHLATVHPWVTVGWKASYRIGTGPLQQAYPTGTDLPVPGPRVPLKLINAHAVLITGGD